MSKFEDITVNQLLEHIKEHNRDKKDNHLIHQITYWYHDIIKTTILREHRQ